MKKLSFLIAGMLLLTTTSFSQVDDRAVIPVAVTLNSILRLNVVSGGNIEFNFNTLQDYTTGKAASAEYSTIFTVASSVDWNVYVYAEDSELIGTDDATGGNVMELDNIGYRLTYDGSGASAADFLIPSFTSTQPLTNTASTILVGMEEPNAGDVNRNRFTINWRCGTTEAGMNPKTILEQSIAPDRYATNVFLILNPVE
jgi:hypothetical protein